MEFVTIRDLRLKPGNVWDRLRRRREISGASRERLSRPPGLPEPG
jgi:hypothetical protein